MAKDPSFLFYYKDFDLDTADWEADAVGWYIRLLCFQAGNGYIPSDKEELAQIARVKFSQYDAFCDRLATRLASKFATDENGRLYNKKLRKIQNERAESAFKARKKSILAVFGNFIKHNNLNKNSISELKSKFDHNKFIEIINDDERSCEILKEISNILQKTSLSDTLSDSLILGNANVNVNEDIVLENKKAPDEIFEIFEEKKIEKTEKKKTEKNVQKRGDLEIFEIDYLIDAPKILLNRTEVAQFSTEYGMPILILAVKKLSDWGANNEAKFFKYKNHAACLRNWALEKAKEDYEKNLKNNQFKNNTNGFKNATTESATEAFAKKYGFNQGGGTVIEEADYEMGE